MEPPERTSEKVPEIIWGGLPSQIIHRITDDELSRLEMGRPSSLFLSFSIFLLSVAISFLAALLTAPFKPGKLFTVFVVVIVIGFAAGLFLLLLWFRTRQEVRDVVSEIKKRMPSAAGERSEARLRGLRPVGTPPSLRSSPAAWGAS